MPTYEEQQILDKACKVTRQKQTKYYDFIPFFDFQYEKNHFQLSALPLFTLLRGPCPKSNESRNVQQPASAILKCVKSLISPYVNFHEMSLVPNTSPH